MMCTLFILRHTKGHFSLICSCRSVQTDFNYTCKECHSNTCIRHYTTYNQEQKLVKMDFHSLSLKKYIVTFDHNCCIFMKYLCTSSSTAEKNMQHSGMVSSRIQHSALSCTVLVSHPRSLCHFLCRKCFIQLKVFLVVLPEAFIWQTQTTLIFSHHTFGKCLYNTHCLFSKHSAL